MSTIVLSNPLGAHWTAGRHGQAEGEAGIRATHAAGLTIVEVAALPGQAQPLRAALEAGFGMTLGDGQPAHSAENAVCTGPGHYLLVGHDVQAVKAAVGDLAMAVDQSSGRVRVSIDGPAGRGFAGQSLPAGPEGVADWRRTGEPLPAHRLRLLSALGTWL